MNQKILNVAINLNKRSLINLSTIVWEIEIWASGKHLEYCYKITFEFLNVMPAGWESSVLVWSYPKMADKNFNKDSVHEFG